jgi:hypothetical protein
MPAKKHPHHETDKHKDYSHKPGEKKAGRPEEVHVSAARVKGKDMKEEVRHRPAPEKGHPMSREELAAAMAKGAPKHVRRKKGNPEHMAHMAHDVAVDEYGDE